MRLSADPHSPYHDARAYAAYILFNGLRLGLGVLEADEEGGWVRYIRRDASGRFWKTRDKEDIREAIAYGAVKIVFLPPHAA